MDMDKVKSEAIRELDEEELREAIDNYKTNLRTGKRFFAKIWPWKISITRR